MVTSPGCLLAEEINRVLVDYRMALARSGTPSPLIASAEHVLARSMPPNWALEWSLPWWLGEGWGLAREITHELVLANVFGLTYIRVQDDFIDGALEEMERVSIPLLSAVLLRTWTEVYTRIGLNAPAFWQSFDDYFHQWLDATWYSYQPPASFDIHNSNDLLTLAHRGAPLKSCAAAACVLTGRGDLLSLVTGALDELLVAAVLLDHAQDWSEDVAAGRWNAFVVYAIGASQPSRSPAETRRMVVQEMTVGLGGRPYFTVIRQYLRSAAAQAQAARLLPLAEYIRWLEDVASVFRSTWVRRERQRLRLATRALLPAASLPDGVSMGGISRKGDHGDGITSTNGSVDRPGTLQRRLSQPAAGRS